MGFKDWMFGKDAEKVDLDRKDTQLGDGDKLRGKAESLMAGVSNRSAPQARKTRLGDAATSNAATIDQSQQAQFRQGQLDLANSLAQQAAGKGPSVSGAQFKAAADTNLAQQQALAAGARGGATALAGRQASQSVSGFNQQAAQQAAIGRMQEQQAAQAQLGSVLNAGRGADIGLATSQAGFNQQTNLANQDATNQFKLQQGQLDQGVNLANLQARLAQTGMDDAAQQAYLSQLTGMSVAELQARMQQDQLEVAQRDPATQGMFGDLMAAGGSIVGGLITASDKRNKKDIKKPNLKDFLDGIPVKFDDAEKDQNIDYMKDAKNFGKAADMIRSGTEKSESGLVRAAGAIGGAIVQKKADDKWRALEKNTRGLDKDERKMLLSRASDRNLKEDIQEDPASVKKFLDQVHPYEYEYKEPDKFGEGKHLGPMAQDLEKSDLGKRMVMDTPEGKMVDYGKGLSTMMASIAYLNEELEKIKKGKK